MTRQVLGFTSQKAPLASQISEQVDHKEQVISVYHHHPGLGWSN